MQGFKNVLQFIFYLIWIPLGILLFAVIIFLMMNNPLSQLGRGSFGGGPASFGGPPDGSQSGFGGPLGNQQR